MSQESYKLPLTPEQARLIKRLSWVLKTLPESKFLQCTLCFDWLWRRILKVPYTRVGKGTSLYPDMLYVSYMGLSRSSLDIILAIRSLPYISVTSSSEGVTLQYRGGRTSMRSPHSLDVLLTSCDPSVILETPDLSSGALFARKAIILLYCTIELAVLRAE